MNGPKKDTTTIQDIRDGQHDVGNGVCDELNHDEHPKEASEPPQDLFNSERGDVNFQGVSWQGAAILIAKFQIGLGALSLPGTFHSLGFFPGVLCFIVLAMIITGAGYMSGKR